MNEKCKPIHKRGKRNVFCPYYGDCLDYVIEKSWEGWDCSDCQHKMTEEARKDISLRSNDSIAYYDLPAELWRKL